VSAKSRCKWTADLLFEHFHAILAERDRRAEQHANDQGQALDAALSATREAAQAALTETKAAIVKSEDSVSERFETHNRFREQILAERANFPTRAEVTASIRAAEVRMDNLAAEILEAKRAIAQFRDRERGLGLGAKILMGTAAFIVALLTIYFTLHGK